MTDWVTDLEETTEEIFDVKWDVRTGRVVPEAEDVALEDGAVKLDATFLYADLAGSSKLSGFCPWGTTAKIIRAYLECSTRLMRAWGGEIRSFDGDRVMGVFMGDDKADHASNCAREIDWVVEKIIDPKATKHFKSVRENKIRVRHCVGIDSGTAVAVRAGIRRNNDLIWIGRAPSLAAKLSDIREYPYAVFISESTYDALSDDAAMLDDGTELWESDTFFFAGETTEIYKTKFMKRP